MSMHDPISDMITRIRNAQTSQKKQVSMPSSKMKVSIAQVLKDEGYIADFSVAANEAPKNTLSIELKYFQGRPVIENICRISKPSFRIYKDKASLPEVLGGLGISIVSTSKGLMSCKKAKAIGLGGEIICNIS